MKLIFPLEFETQLICYMFILKILAECVLSVPELDAKVFIY